MGLSCVGTWSFFWTSEDQKIKDEERGWGLATMPRVVCMAGCYNTRVPCSVLVLLDKTRPLPWDWAAFTPIFPTPGWYLNELASPAPTQPEPIVGHRSLAGTPPVPQLAGFTDLHVQLHLPYPAPTANTGNGQETTRPSRHLFSFGL